MSESEKWSQFHNVLGLGSFTRRLDILRRQYLNHRFDRRSPIPPIENGLLEEIYSFEVTFPPRKHLMAPGTQTIDGLFFLVCLAKWLKAASVFEIGTFVGLTARTLATNLPDAVIDTLDIPPDDSPRFQTGDDDVHRGSEERMLYRAMEGGGEVRQHWSDSATFDFSPWSGKVDLVYIDGAHSEEYVRSDTDNALRMVAPGGAVVWDDYWRVSPGVAKVLNERNDLNRMRIPGTRLVVHLAR